MTQEEKKDLLLKDLSSRLPYGVKISLNNGKEAWTLKGMFDAEHTGVMLILEPPFPSKNAYPSTSNWQLSQCKPYLRPMSSMTEEEEKEYELLANRTMANSVGFVHFEATELLDWLKKNFFDYRGMIGYDLAIEVTEDNNPYK